MTIPASDLITVDQAWHGVLRDVPQWAKFRSLRIINGPGELWTCHITYWARGRWLALRRRAPWKKRR